MFVASPAWSSARLAAYSLTGAPTCSITDSSACGVSYKYSLQQSFLAQQVPTCQTVNNLLHKKLLTPCGPMSLQDLVVTCFQVNIQRTFTGITKPCGMSVYLKAGHIRSYLTSLTFLLECFVTVNQASHFLLRKKFPRDTECQCELNKLSLGCTYFSRVLKSRWLRSQFTQKC